MENIIEFDDKQNINEQIEELESKIEKMKADKETKCEAAKKQLIDMLGVTADKYRTATGVAEALRVLRFAYGEQYDAFEDAASLARELCNTTDAMQATASLLDPNEMDSLCEGFYDPDFASNKNIIGYELAKEMMRIDLCRNVGSAAEDMVSFVKRVDEEIEATKKAIEDLKE